MRCETLSSDALPSPLLWLRASIMTIDAINCRLFLTRWVSSCSSIRSCAAACSRSRLARSVMFSIADPVGRLLQQHTFVCGRVFTLKPRALGDVFDCQEDLLYLVAKPVDFARVEHLNITLAANSVGRLLVQYTCQKPLHRAIERDGSLVRQWLEKDRNSGRWPRKQGADISAMRRTSAQ